MTTSKPALAIDILDVNQAIELPTEGLQSLSIYPIPYSGLGSLEDDYYFQLDDE